MDTTLLYVTNDGSYGDATDLLLVNATDFTNEDFLSIDSVDDRYRMEEAAEIGVYRSAEPLVWAWMTENEAAQMLDALETAIGIAIKDGHIGLAESLGDVRDVLNRSGITDDPEIGRCDCGTKYDASSRADHDADTGQCWDCSDRHIDTMTDTERDAYIQG